MPGILLFVPDERIVGNLTALLPAVSYNGAQAGDGQVRLVGVRGLSGGVRGMTAIDKNSSLVRENKPTIDLLLKQLRRGSVIPYVGAGLSTPFGFEGWTAFLLSASPREIRAEIKTYIGTEKFEEAAEKLREHLGHLTFEDTLEQKFGPAKLDGKFDGFAEAGLDEALPAVLYVPALAKGPVATTNLDHVLERTYDFYTAPLRATVWGGRSRFFKKAIIERRPVLLKVHGDVLDNADRVLTKSEYDAHYKDSADEGQTSPTLYDLLHYLVNNSSLLFLGCSLKGDRLMQLLQRGKDDPQVHYAFVRRPPKADLAARRKFLGDHCIRPIWYDSHQQLGPLLDYLVRESYDDGFSGQLREAESNGDWQRAIKLALTMQRKGTPYPPQRNAYLSRLHQRYAKSLVESGDLSGAVSQLRQATMATPSDLSLKSQFIEMLIRSGRIDEAEIEIEEAEQQGVEPSDICKLRALCLLARGPGDEGIEAHGKTLAEYTEASCDPRLQRAVAVVNALLTHQIEDLRTATQTLAATRPDDQVLAALAGFLNATGKAAKFGLTALWAAWAAPSVIGALKDLPVTTVLSPAKFRQWAINEWVLQEAEVKVITGAIIDVKGKVIAPATERVALDLKSGGPKIYGRGLMGLPAPKTDEKQ